MNPSKRMGILSPAMLWLATGCAATAPAYVATVPDAQPARPSAGGRARRPPSRSA